jgi:hypothetical protein
MAPTYQPRALAPNAPSIGLRVSAMQRLGSHCNFIVDLPIKHGDFIVVIMGKSTIIIINLPIYPLVFGMFTGYFMFGDI